MAHKTINNKWSELSTNRINFNEEEVGVGILYKGAVVSNQLNGLGFAIYEMLDFIQRTGGLYNSAKKYLGDDVVSILRKDHTGPLRVEQYRCISTSENGITNLPPIMNAAYDENDRIPIFQGGYVDTRFWVRCDVLGYGEIYQERTDFSNTQCIRLFNFSEIDTIDASSAKIQGEYNFTVYFEDKVTSFTVKLEGAYTKTLTDEVVILPNRLGIQSPEIFFSNVRSNIIDYGEENDFHSLMPFGIRFEYNESLDDSSIYMRLRPGIRKITIAGLGQYVDVELQRDVELISNYTIIPVRSGGGFDAFNEIGTIESKDYNVPVEMQYKLGLYKLSAEASGFTPDENTTPNDSPLWGNDKNAGAALFGYLYKIRGTWQVPQWQGAFLRNVEENKIPGLPEDTPVRPIGSFQGDAIRLSTSTASAEGTFEGGRGNLSGAFKSLGNGGEYALNNGAFTSRLLKIALSLNTSALNIPTSHDTHPANVAVQFYYKAF